MPATKTVSFWTIGEDFTLMVRDLIRSGSFYNAIEILKDGGFDKTQVLMFMLGKYKFVGDTRDGNGLEVLVDEGEMNNDLLICGWRTLIAGEDFEEYEPYHFHAFERLVDENKHLKSLTEIVPLTYVRGLIWQELLRNEGYKVYEKAPQHVVQNGVILRNGWFVECGYQSHVYLYPILHELGFADDPHWTKDESLVHITSSRIAGAVGHAIEHYWRENNVKPSEEQIDALFDWRNQFTHHYGYPNTRTVESLRGYIIEKYGKGAKYGNLQFLKRFYKFNIPEISLEPLDTTYCIRTSPKYSLAGLLNSKFDIHENSEKEIWADWEKYKDIKPNNELSIFYQQYLTGENGVAHYITKGDFNYEVSSNRGDIVNGKKGSTSLSLDHYMELRDICRTLHDDLGEQIQVEFVIRTGKLWIVQLRTIKKPKTEDFDLNNIEDIIATGRSFTIGEVTCDLKDVLVVEEDSPSEALLGKKALIVKNDVDFSHILALSQSLGIPSIYGLQLRGKLPKRITMTTTHRTGIITEAKE